MSVFSHSLCAVWRLAIPCFRPVLGQRMLLRAPYALSRTKAAYMLRCAILRQLRVLRLRYALPGTELGYAPTRYTLLLCFVTRALHVVLAPFHYALLCDVQYCHRPSHTTLSLLALRICDVQYWHRPYCATHALRDARH
eukprot:2345413-Rhodomonas_salina.2